MTVWFRTDAALWIGNGHVMRCVTLADALWASGIECRFICRAYPGNLIAHIRTAGHIVYELPNDGESCSGGAPDFSDWLRDSVERDAELALAVLKERVADWLVVDHYALSAAWEERVSPRVGQIMVIDDLTREHTCQLLLDQTLGRSAREYHGLVPADTRLFCGADYALLRSEFAAQRALSLQRRKTSAVRQLLISMGGVDSSNVTGQVLEVLSAMTLPDTLAVTVVLGPHAPWVASVREQLKILPGSTTLAVGVDDMASLMAQSDIAIGAAGSSAWERCCLGVPSIMVVLADNQRDVAASLKKAGAAYVIDDASSLSDSLPVLLLSLLMDSDVRSRMSRLAAAVVDGRGVRRVVDEIQGGA